MIDLRTTAIFIRCYHFATVSSEYFACFSKTGTSAGGAWGWVTEFVHEDLGSTNPQCQQTEQTLLHSHGHPLSFCLLKADPSPEVNTYYSCSWFCLCLVSFCLFAWFVFSLNYVCVQKKSTILKPYVNLYKY